MKRDTRAEILKAAKALFNERGYHGVSTQDIANAMGISKGNLTYHFKKKEQIVEAIIEDNSKNMQLPEVPKTLNEMNALFLHIQNVVHENAFYFWNHTQFSQLSHKICEQQHKAHDRNVDIFVKAFALFQEEEILRKQEYSGEYERVIDMLLLCCVYWIPFCKSKQSQSCLPSFQHHIWSVIYPYLTEKGKEILPVRG